MPIKLCLEDSGRKTGLLEVCLGANPMIMFVSLPIATETTPWGLASPSRTKELLGFNLFLSRRTWTNALAHLVSVNGACSSILQISRSLNELGANAAKARPAPNFCSQRPIDPSDSSFGSSLKVGGFLEEKSTGTNLNLVGGVFSFGDIDMERLLEVAEGERRSESSSSE